MWLDLRKKQSRHMNIFMYVCLNVYVQEENSTLNVDCKLNKEVIKKRTS